MPHFALIIYFLQPIMLEEILESYKHRITELIQEHRIGPELQMQDFDEHITLINETDIEYVEGFMNAEPPHGFEEYAEQIAKYDNLAKNIPVGYDQTFFSGLFDVHRKDLMDYLASAANDLKEELVNRMVSDYQHKSRAWVEIVHFLTQILFVRSEIRIFICNSIGEEYQDIADKALSVPPDTAELMKLRAFVAKAETDLVLDLENRLKDTIKYIQFLSDYTLLSPVELKTNNFAFQW